MYQSELFTGLAKKHGDYVGSGLFASVYKMTDGNVCKIARNDGTRNWLEFCAAHTANNTLKPYMPEVFSVVSLEDSMYMAFMPCYAEFTGDRYAFYDAADFKAARRAFGDYLEMLGEEELTDYDVFNDLHNGNIMVCSRRGVIITDPSAIDYIKSNPETTLYLN